MTEPKLLCKQMLGIEVCTYEFDVRDRPLDEVLRIYLDDVFADLILPFKRIEDNITLLSSCSRCVHIRRYTIAGIPIALKFVSEEGTTAGFEYIKVEVPDVAAVRKAAEIALKSTIRKTVKRLVAYWFDGVHTEWHFKEGAPLERIEIRNEMCCDDHPWRDQCANDCRDHYVIFEAPISVFLQELEKALTKLGPRIAEIMKEIERYADEMDRMLKQVLSEELELLPPT